MPKPVEELESILELLKIEKEEDFEQFKNFVQRLSLSERREKGYTWYPVQVVRSGYTIGERAFVIVERTVNEEEAVQHLFRSGKVVQLFTNQENPYQPEKRGVINYVQKNRMKIILNSKDLPDWLGDGLIGVDLMFDETSYLEMEKALLKVMKAKGDRLAELRDILFVAKATNRKIPVATPVLPQLNKSQVEAVHQILQTPDVAVIHGPPGTGKTTTLVQAIRQATQSEAVVLVTAPSNAAVDLLTERIAQQGINVVRIGNISRIDESLLQHTLDLKMSSHPDSKHIKKVKIQAADYRRMARKYKRSFGRKEREQRNLLHKEARELSSWANQLEDRLLDQILHSAAVITCTLVGASQSMLDRLKFKTVFIDEAAQALEPATWIPILRASKVVLAGDPFQLPPTVKSNLAMRQGFNKTMIERCIEMAPSEDTPSVSLLKVQYRMNEKIMAFSNRQFYDNQLRAAEQVCGWSLGLEDESVVSFIDTAGCSFDEKINPAYQSRYNPDEYNILREHLYKLLDRLKGKAQSLVGLAQNEEAINPSNSVSPPEAAAESDEENTSPTDAEALPSIGIISPYREQVIHMKKEVEEDERLQSIPLSIDTIDGFQGQERDVIYISLVRSNGKGEIGFLKDIRRMNVAMTRARKMLVIIGDSSTIGQYPFYADFIKFCESENFYKSAWEYML